MCVRVCAPERRRVLLPLTGMKGIFELCCWLPVHGDLTEGRMGSVQSMQGRLTLIDMLPRKASLVVP